MVILIYTKREICTDWADAEIQSIIVKGKAKNVANKNKYVMKTLFIFHLRSSFNTIMISKW